jgi:hypothetical protein
MARSQYSQRSTLLKKGFTWLVIGLIPLLFADVGWTAGPSGGAPGKASGAVGRQYGGVLRVVDAAPALPSVYHGKPSVLLYALLFRPWSHWSGWIGRVICYPV